jgi:hypothetical protein
MIILLVLVYIVIGLFQIPNLIKKKYWRDLAAFSCFIIAAFALSLLYSLDINIPSPFIAVHYVLDALHMHY